MLGEILTLEITGFMVLFARLGTAFMVIPGFSAPYVTTQVRVLVALTLTLLMVPLLRPTLPPLPQDPMAIGVLLATEIFTGAFIGTLVMILVATLSVMGMAIAMSTGMANANVQDPITNQQGSVYAAFLSNTALALIFVSDMHHLILQALVDSYSLFPPGQWPNTGDTIMLMARFVADSFQMAIKLAMPSLTFSLIVFIGMGILTRLMPQVPVFFVVMPLNVLLGAFMVMTVLPTLMYFWAKYFEESVLKFVVPG